MTCECEKRKNYNAIHALIDTFRALLGRKNVFISKTDQQARIAICNDCADKTDIRCSICGCIIALKTKFRLSSCPRGKW
jgi:hypothetical protein